MSPVLNRILWIYQRKWKCLFLLLFWLVIVGVYHTYKPLPEGIGIYGSEWSIPEYDVQFLHDLTYENGSGEIIHDQELFDTIFDIINNSRRYILIDMFLFNSHLGRGIEPYRKLSGEMTSLLLHKKRENPGLQIDIITDDINNVYGGAPSPELKILEKAGANIIITNHKPLRDSNFIYSPLWRTFFQWFGNSDRSGLLPHPFSHGERNVTLRSYLSLLNFKANHRKIVMADAGDRLTGVIMSANCHDASSAHSNVGFLITGNIWEEIYDGENMIASLSGKQLRGFAPDTRRTPDSHKDNNLSVRTLSEKAIKDALIRHFNETTRGDSISIAMFYLTERDIIHSILKASERGVFVRIILDPSKDAFGYEKHGIPNRQVAKELMSKSRGRIQIRWANTHGEQFHSKLVLIRKETGITTVFLGSANLTRRNINNYNLEFNLEVSSSNQSACLNDVRQYFERIWQNKYGNRYTLNYQIYMDNSYVRTFLYRIYEYTGLSTF